MPEGITPLAYSHARTDYDKLPLPNGKTVGEEPNVTSVLAALEVPGVSHSNGRLANVTAYADYLSSIHNDAGTDAINAWLADKRSAL